MRIKANSNRELTVRLVFTAKVVTDRVSGYSKGFGFVRYATLEDSAKGIAGMDGKVIFIFLIYKMCNRNQLCILTSRALIPSALFLCSFLTAGSYSQSMQDQESHIDLTTTCLLLLLLMVTAIETRLLLLRTNLFLPVLCVILLSTMIELSS